MVALFEKQHDCQRRLFEPHQELDQMELVMRMVEMDAGGALLMAALVAAEVADHRRAAVPFADGGHTESLAVIHLQKGRWTPAMNNFNEFLKRPMGAAN
jgi:DNA-binding transcriptional LysR family regulator